MRITNAELVEAVQYGQLDKVRAALKDGCDVNYSEPERDGYTLVQWAVQQGHVKVLELLVKHGADIEATGEDSPTPLCNAAGDGNLEMVTALVALGANVNAAPRYGTALHTAVAYQEEEILYFLIEKGADINALDNDGQTPIFFAALYHRADLVQLLISHGARIDIKDNEGQLPFDLAKGKADEVAASFKAVAKFLI